VTPTAAAAASSTSTVTNAKTLASTAIDQMDVVVYEATCSASAAALLVCIHGDGRNGQIHLQFHACGQYRRARKEQLER